MPDTSCTQNMNRIISPITKTRPSGTLVPTLSQAGQSCLFKPAVGTIWATYLGTLRRFVQLRSRGRIGLLPSPPEP